MTPIARYKKAIATGQFYADTGQQAIIEQLQIIYEQWCQQHLLKRHSLLSRFAGTCAIPVKGMYLWGGVGAGKTWLMDLFYSCLPEKLKLRLHFHRFMQRIHHELGRYQGQANPLRLIARQFAKDTKLIFLDEFIVNDITDAMLLGNLLAALFAEGVSLIATSNVPPEGLYRNGLQRDRFLPAIALLNEHLHVRQARVQVDYRLRTLEQADVYFYPLGDSAEAQLLLHYQHFAHHHTPEPGIVMLAGRPIPTLGCSNEIVWFDFNALCSIPRSQLDYLEIARLYSTVILGNIPFIMAEQDNQILYFINLIDVFYDAQVKLIISAAGPVNTLYPQGRYAFEFQRTQSRLLEMQSRAYLDFSHLV